MPDDQPIRIGRGEFTYDWQSDWLSLPEVPMTRKRGQTHGIGVLSSGGVVLFAQTAPQSISVFTPGGELRRRFGDYPGAHGLSIAREGDREVLWVTDIGRCTVQKVSLEGEVLLELPAPPLAPDKPAPAQQKYMPTWASAGPDGDVWVADGYGTHFVYRFAPDGTYRGRIGGEEGAGRFNEPHSVRFSPEGEGGEGGEMWITDRSNLRVCVYDAEGRYLRHSDTACHSPADFAFRGGRTYVAEIAGGVKVLDADLNVLASLGDNPDVTPHQTPGNWWPADTPPGWPNDRSTLRPGVFHTPHGIAVTPRGDVLVAEWVVGGRVVRLRAV